MPEEKLNAWGEPIEDEDPNDEYWVPPEERKDTDDDDPEGNSNALDADTGDDLTGVEIEGLTDQPDAISTLGKIARGEFTVKGEDKPEDEQ